MSPVSPVRIYWVSYPWYARLAQRLATWLDAWADRHRRMILAR